MSVSPQPCGPETEVGFSGPDEARAWLTTTDDGDSRTVLIESTATDGASTPANGNVNITAFTYESIDFSFFGVNVGGAEIIQAQRTGTGEATIHIGGAMVPGMKLGFLGAAGVTRPTVTGSRGGNAALASLLTALANLGLITNSTSA